MPHYNTPMIWRLTKDTAGGGGVLAVVGAGEPWVTEVDGLILVPGDPAQRADVAVDLIVGESEALQDLARHGAVKIGTGVIGVYLQSKAKLCNGPGMITPMIIHCSQVIIGIGCWF